MRLINTLTYQLEEFTGRNIPRYAILSHTWEDEEASFTAFTNSTCIDTKGYRKIIMACREAARNQLQYAWVDTCCIDKSSSAELSEAINSMYRWYQRAAVCYTYLADLPSTASLDTCLSQCRWFTRGWCLQELVAPEKLLFYDQEWRYRGTKSELVDQLTTITGISADVLCHTRKLSSVAVAQKMSWASHRETTRIEDMAYCLLGIFDINMPLLYGEEEKAFRRLQEEIIRTTPDLSILAWASSRETYHAKDHYDRDYSGVLAESPKDFSECGSVSSIAGARQEFVISNVGTKLTAGMIVSSRTVLPLGCTMGSSELGILLQICGSGQYLRHCPWELVRLDPSDVNSVQWRVIHILTDACLLNQLPNLSRHQRSSTENIIAGIRFNVIQLQLPSGYEVSDCWPPGHYSSADQLFFLSGDTMQDCFSLRLSLDLEVQVGSLTWPMAASYTFHATGWSSQEPEKLQCSLVDIYKYQSQTTEMHTKTSMGNYNTYIFISWLRYHNIPKRNWISSPVGTPGYSVFLSYETSLVNDPSVCRNKFWRVRFWHRVLPTHELPAVEFEDWHD